MLMRAGTEGDKFSPARQGIGEKPLYCLLLSGVFHYPECEHMFECGLNLCYNEGKTVHLSD